MAYSQIPLHIWTPEFRSLSLEAKVLWLHMRANTMRNSEGLFTWPPGHAMADTGLSPERYSRARGELVEAGFISYDSTTEAVLDRHALVHYQPTGPKQLAGALRVLKSVPDTPLLDELLEVARELAPDLALILTGKYERDVTNPQTGEVRRVRHQGHPRWDLSNIRSERYPIDRVFSTPDTLSRVELEQELRSREGFREELVSERETEGNGLRVSPPNSGAGHYAHKDAP